MRNKYFSYSFQLSNTRKIIIIFFIVVLALAVSYLFFIKNKTDKENINGLRYKKVLGMEEFDDSNCDVSYRVYYDKKTCGSVCLNVTSKDNNYLKNKEKEMKENGFITTGIKTRNIHLKKWKYFYTKNAGPIFNYYAFLDDNKLYSVEIINQSGSFSQEVKSKCNANIDKITSSLEVK